MMKKKQSKKMNQLKYLVLIPVLLSMLFYTSCSSSRQVTKTAKAIEIIEEVERIERVTEIEEVSFMVIDKAPTFPGCSSGDKDCFSKMVQKHFSENFDAKMPNGLGLSSGKKRVFIGFKVDVNGDVVGIKVRAPHPEIKEEVLRVMRSLPKMMPGEKDGVKIGVSFNIPFAFMVDEVTKD